MHKEAAWLAGFVAIFRSDGPSQAEKDAEGLSALPQTCRWENWQTRGTVCVT